MRPLGLANLLFSFELDRRARAAGRDLLAVAAHPGLTDTELAVNYARMYSAGPFAQVMRWGNKLIAQGVAGGTLPQLYAATARCAQWRVLRPAGSRVGSPS